MLPHCLLIGQGAGFDIGEVCLVTTVDIGAWLCLATSPHCLLIGQGVELDIWRCASSPSLTQRRGCAMPSSCLVIDQKVGLDIQKGVSHFFVLLSSDWSGVRHREMCLVTTVGGGE